MTHLLLRLFVCDYTDVKNQSVRENYGKLGGIVGIICNVILSAIKIAVGIITASISITADGLNNLSDMGSSVITLIGFKMANKPADSDHPYGHGRIEYLAAFIVSMLIMLMGGELMISSVKTLLSGKIAPTYSLWAIIALVLSVAIKFWMFIFNRKLGKSIDSDVLTATAQDCANDCIATTAILISAAVSMIIKLPFNLDAVMALAVGVFILWSGLSAAKDTVSDLLGNPPAKELVEEMERIILSFEQFIGIHDLIVHNYGPGRQFASVHVEVPQNIDMVTCHEQIDLCEKLVNERTGVMLVIHMDPIDINNEVVNQTRKKLETAIKSIDERLTLHDFRMTPSGKERTNLIFDVVVPSDVSKSDNELKYEISRLAADIDPKYVCVITIDNMYV